VSWANAALAYSMLSETYRRMMEHRQEITKCAQARVSEEFYRLLRAAGQLGQHHLAVHGNKWKLIAKVQGTQGDDAGKRPDWDTTNTSSTRYELYNFAADPLEPDRHDCRAVRELERILRIVGGAENGKDITIENGMLPDENEPIDGDDGRKIVN
jgi:hypothetical protein